MSYSRILVTQEPQHEPLTLEEVKNQLRIEFDFTDDDIYLTSLIIAARKHCESYTNRFLAPGQRATVLFHSTTEFILPPDSTIVSISGMTEHEYEFNELLSEITFVNQSPQRVMVNIETGKVYPQANRAMAMFVADMYEQRTSLLEKNNKAAENMLDDLKWYPNPF